MAGLPPVAVAYPSTVGSAASSRRSSVSGTSVASATSTQLYVPVQKRRQLKLATHDNALLSAQVDSAELTTKLARTVGNGLPQFSLPFFLRKSQLQFLQERFPRTLFKCTSDNAHDHPLAHAETMIATQKALYKAPAGSVIVDVYGNVGAMESFTRSQARQNTPKRGFAYIDYLSPKAFIRHRNIGDPVGANGVTRYIESVEGATQDLQLSREGMFVPGYENVPGKDIVWLFKHTLYYMSDEQIQEFLNVENSVGYAIVHRHAKDSGQLFDGECTYAKKGTTVNQVNVLTGESYTHRDLSWLWDSAQKVKYTNSGAFTWTFNMVSPETWIVEMVAIPKGLDERFRARERLVGPQAAAEEMNTHDLVPIPFPHPSLAAMPDAECRLVGGVPVVKFKEEELPDCRVTNVELYEFLCTAVVGKPRDPERLQDLFALARSHALNASEFPGKKSFNVRAEDVASHVMLAFLTGLKRETRLLRAMSAHDVWRREHNSLLDGVVVHATTRPESGTRSLVMAAKRVNTARKAGDWFDGVLHALDN